MKNEKTGYETALNEAGAGVKLIAQERWEQIHKHGFDVANDQYYSKGELMDAALYTITLNPDHWPEGWDDYHRDKIAAKTVEQRMAVAGAFCAAEIDRRKLIKQEPKEPSNPPPTNNKPYG